MILKNKTIYNEHKNPIQQAIKNLDKRTNFF